MGIAQWRDDITGNTECYKGEIYETQTSNNVVILPMATHDAPGCDCQLRWLRQYDEYHLLFSLWLKDIYRTVHCVI